MEVTADDLTKPLGLEEGRRRRWPSFRVPVAPIFAGLLAVVLGAAAVYVTFVDDPLAGEPHAIVPIEIAAAPVPEASVQAPRDEAAVPPADGPRSNASQVETASGVSVMRPNGGSVPGSLIIRLPDPDAGKLAPAPDARLVERGRYGFLPKIGPDGAKAWQIYAARGPKPLPGGARPAGRVAILITGLGISQSATAAAVTKLPPTVSFAFAPYGAELEKHVAAARAEGHEVMLQVPMEPFDYPDNDPGPHTLTARARPQENLDRLHWAMGRFTGYIGLVNFMGAKLTAEEGALSPILREVASRGLAFLDDGSSSRSVLGQAAASAGVPAARGDMVLDAIPQVEAVDRELVRLEELARKRGLAVATASALPLTVDRIARWAKSLEGKNLQLVPVSTAFAEGR